MQNRPDGLLGHRKEPAASVDLTRRSTDAGPRPGDPAADGGRQSGGEGDE